MDRAVGVSKDLLSPGLMLTVLLTVAPWPGVQAARTRSPEVCFGGWGLGDKWFDGCQWCVCTVRGALCSRSECSSLVRQVAPCHEVGLRWTDGCYRCRCRRNGIACRLDVTCLLLRHRPAPCLADERCVCGLDGVPSCTAEVIDRNAFAAKRVDIILPPFLDPEAERHDHHHALRMRGGSYRPRGLRASRRHHQHQRRREAEQGQEVSQELLITSDNLCRFGPRWYGGSLRCFCDVDGAITCGNPAFVTAFYDDFRVERKECEEGHLWEEGCSICSCRRNGVVFCRHDRQCRHRYDDDEDVDIAVDNDDDNEIELVDTDHYLPGFTDDANDLSGDDDGGDDTFPRVLPNVGNDLSVLDRIEGVGDLPRVLPSRAEACEVGMRWNEGCKQCLCNRLGRPVCVKRRSRRCDADDAGDESDNNTGRDDDGGYDYTYDADYDARDREPPSTSDKDYDDSDSRRENEEVVEGEEGSRNEARGRRGNNEKPKRNRLHHRGSDAANWTQPPRYLHGRSDETRKPPYHRNHNNAVHERPATLKPFYNRVPRQYMTVPKPQAVFRGPPAYSRPTAYRPSPCGRFKVGEKFWRSCNLCLCTSKGPRCQGKLCW